MTKDKKVLNKQQLAAIKHGQGPLLIIAGAGTGKTTVITERIKHLISTKKAKPDQILGLTFTEKAALEMEERVDKVLPYGYTQMFISTFHSFCDRLLRDEAMNIGLNPHYVLMTEAETLLFLRRNLFDFKLKYFRPAGNPEKFLSGLLTHFNRLRDEDISPKGYLAYAKQLKAQPQDKAGQEQFEKTQELAEAYEKYEQLKEEQGLMDFAGLINNTLKLFRSRKNILSQYQDQFKYILVDEFQDTNLAQNELVLMLAGQPANLTCVADDDQSIYRFRGSSVANVLQFKDHYPKAKVVTLTKNYRSTQEILNRAYSLIQHNNPDRLEIKEEIDKKLVSARKIKGEEIGLLIADRVENEAELVAKKVENLVGAGNKFKYGDIAVLVRANNHADAFVRAFLRRGVPFQFLGPGKLLRQEEVKDLTAYLKVLYNFEDNVAFFRLLSLPIFGLSARDIAGLRSLAKKENLSLFEAAEQLDKASVSQSGKKKITKIVKMVYRHLALIPQETAGQILYFFLEDTGMLEELAEVNSQKRKQEVNNIAKFFDKIKTYEAEHEDASVETVVDWLNLKMEMGESPLASDSDWSRLDKVNILTVHSAKGLEFPVVFLVNLVNARFPTRRRKEPIPIPEELIKEQLPEGDFHDQEERRLFYVGMTRARDRLFFTAARYYGEGKRVKKISPFVYQALGEKKVNQQLKIAKTRQEDQLSIFDFQKPKKTTEAKIQPVSRKVDFLSYSQLNTFKRCPQQYQYRYLLQIPTPFAAAASFGVSIHQSLKDFYQRILEGKKPSQQALWRFLKDNWKKEGYSSKQHEKKMYQRAKKYLAGFYDRLGDQKGKPVGLEQPFTIKLGSGLKLGGRIDRVDKLADGRLEIIDYKTGKVYQQQKVDQDLQMTIYAMAGVSRAIYGRPAEDLQLSFYFLKEQKKISTKRTKEQIKAAEKEIIGLAKEIEKSAFLPSPSPLCDFCDYKLLCPAWQ